MQPAQSFLRVSLGGQRSDTILVPVLEGTSILFLATSVGGRTPGLPLTFRVMVDSHPL